MTLDPHHSAGSEHTTPAFNINQLALHASLALLSQAGLLACRLERRLSHGENLDKDQVISLCASVYGLVQYLGISAANEYLNDALPPNELAVALTAAPPELANLSLNHVNPSLMRTALALLGNAGKVIDALRAQYETGSLNQATVDGALANAGHILGQALDAEGV